VPFAINSAKQLKAGLKHISRNADVLLAIPDQTVYSGKTAKEVLLFSYRNRIPFIGLSASWVKAGALYALGIDYRDLGRQAAELANNILAGTPPEKTSSYPDKIIYTMNSRTMDHLHLNINNDLIKGSAKVFE
jgi:putative ABC transport system substrate-binding protein